MHQRDWIRHQKNHLDQVMHTGTFEWDFVVCTKWSLTLNYSLEATNRNMEPENVVERETIPLIPLGKSRTASRNTQKANNDPPLPKLVQELSGTSISHKDTSMPTSNMNQTQSSRRSDSNPKSDFCVRDNVNYKCYASINSRKGTLWLIEQSLDYFCCCCCCTMRRYEMASDFTNTRFRDEFISTILQYKTYQMFVVFLVCMGLLILTIM